MDEDVPREPEEFWHKEYTTTEHEITQTIITTVNWTEQWLVPVESALKSRKDETLTRLLIRMVCTLLMNYFPEEYGWEWDMVEAEGKVKDEEIYLVECHDGNDPTEHLLVLILPGGPDGPHGPSLTHSLLRFKRICQLRFGIIPQDEGYPAVAWGAIFQGARAAFYQGHGATSPWGHGSGLNTPESREREYSPVSARDTAFHDASIDSLPGPSALEDLRASQTADQNGPESQQLSPNDMIAPVGAMHSMSVNLLGSNNIFMDNPANGDTKGDIVTRGIVTEERARVMYERFMGGSKNFLPLFDPIRDTFDSIRSRSVFCFTVIIYLASRAVTDLRSDTHLQRVLQDEAQRLAEDGFFERPTKLEAVQGMILLAAYSEKTWFSTALILRTALDSGLEKSLDTLLSQENVPRSSLTASMADRQLVWQTRTWLISFTLELDVASGTGRKSRIAEVDIMKLRKFLEYPLSLPCDMRTVCIIELHQLRGQSRVIIENSSTIDHIVLTELPAIMGRLQNWWTTWDEIHNNNGFHAGAFQRSSLKLMLNYARIFVLCASLARIQKLLSAVSSSDPETMDLRVLNLWQSLVTTIMDLLAFIITEPAYRCQLEWAPTYPALTIAFVTTFALRIARWRPTLIDQDLLLERVHHICEFLKQPPYPDIHRTVSLFVNYARALIVSQRPRSHDSADAPNMPEHGDVQEPLSGRPDASVVTTPPTGLAPLEDTSYRPGAAFPGDKETSAVSMPSNDKAAISRPPLSRFAGTMEAPNWTMNPIADSFGLFEEGQNDLFDFLPVMPSLPQ
ncbi:putative C6 transcription factor [Aspergillus bombycis]|uniref:Putative C6 transcription factor n=1 Tax=Aspergillus bombycis TaxID=109264 RepID=A0A1F7ZX69_9EURO|nr:putative C6 transcription factor [Aspergillus bombycis]OGM44072.1 putative C6 transcription factor [Aspergillus bombycis]